jgi:hypothetical protein
MAVVADLHRSFLIPARVYAAGWGEISPELCYSFVLRDYNILFSFMQYNIVSEQNIHKNQ